MVLTGKRRGCEISKVECVDLMGEGTGVRQRFLTGFHSQRSKIAIGKSAKLGLSRTHNRYFSHIF